MTFKNYLGEEFQTVEIRRDGITCRFCQRVIRVRERAALFVNNNGYECRDCLYDEPITDHNRSWREKHRERSTRRTSTPPAGRWDIERGE